MSLRRLNLYNTERTTGKQFGVLALLGLMLIPAVLAASFTWTQADATENLDRLEAAVVNLDQPVTIDDELVPIGRLMVMRLIDSDAPVNIGWTLTDEEDAAEGLESGRFAAVVTIPEDFSANATSVQHMDPAKLVPAVLDVQTSTSAGVMDPTIGQALSTTITNALNTELTNTYLKNMYVKLIPQKKQFAKAVDGSGMLADGLDQAHHGSLQLVDGLAKLAWGTGKVADGNQQLADGLGLMHDKTKDMPAKIQLMADGGNQLADGLNELNDGVKGYSGTIRDALSTIREADAKSGAQQEQLKAATAALGNVDARLDEATAQCQPETMRDTPPCQTLTGLAGTIGQIRNDLGVESLNTTLTRLMAALDDIDGVALKVDQLITGINQLAWGSSKLAGGLDKLNAAVPQLVDGIGQAASGADLLADGSRQVADGAATAAEEVKALPEGLAQLADGAHQLHGGLADAQGQMPDWTKAETKQMVDGLTAPVQPQVPTLPNPDLSAGYFTALALAIAALVVFMLIRAVPSESVSSTQNATVLTWQAYRPALVIAALQALTVALALQLSLDLPLPKLAAFAGIVFLAAACMLAISQALVAAMGGGGRFVALFAIAVSAPTALISTTPDALQVLVDLTPISPTIDALRGVITGANVAGDITALLVWGLAGLVVTICAITKERQVSVRALARYAA